MTSSKARHAKKARERKAAKAATNTRAPKALPGEALERLPKLSATMLEFAKPITSEMPNPPGRENMETAMVLAQIAWNLPLLRQRNLNTKLSAQWAAIAPTLPPPVLAILEGMMSQRLTVHAHDPRIANVEVRENRYGEITVYAETRLLGGTDGAGGIR
jgi:hypothetical protein